MTATSIPRYINDFHGKVLRETLDSSGIKLRLFSDFVGVRYSTLLKWRQRVSHRFLPEYHDDIVSAFSNLGYASLGQRFEKAIRSYNIASLEEQKPESLGSLFKVVRIYGLNMDSRQLGETLSYHQSTISHKERGKAPISYDDIIKLESLIRLKFNRPEVADYFRKEYSRITNQDFPNLINQLTSKQPKTIGELVENVRKVALGLKRSGLASVLGYSEHTIAAKEQ